MNDWRRWLYTFPPHELDSLLKVMNAMPDDLWDEWGFDSTDWMVVTVRDFRAVIFLLAALDESRLFGRDSDPNPDEYGVLIRSDQYGIARALLQGCGRAKAKWHSVVEIAIGSDAAQVAFDRAYEAFVGVR